jgi:hypothetical protein
MRARGAELAEGLFPDQHSAVIADLKQLGKPGWTVWLSENLHDCLDYLQATPASRKKKKWTSDTQNHRRLILGALVFHRAAVLFQETWEQHDDCKGLGYRDAHRSAAEDGWNAIISFQKFSFYPLEFLDDLVLLAGGIYGNEVKGFCSDHAPADRFDADGRRKAFFEKG